MHIVMQTVLAQVYLVGILQEMVLLAPAVVEVGVDICQHHQLVLGG
jgi:hypothetical protein